MIFTIENRDLFSVPKDYSLVHCISADFALGAGIAKEFTKRGVRNELLTTYGYFCGNIHCVGRAFETNATDWNKEYSLVTKKYYWQKPTYDALIDALLDLKKHCKNCEINKLAMPKIGCGLDKLKWDRVEAIIKEIFKDCDVDILVCDWR